MDYRKIGLIILAGLLMLPLTAPAAELGDILKKRLAGDRSGACVIAARVGEGVEWASYCADPGNERVLDRSSRFEIGSVSKMLQGVVSAALVEEGLLTLDEPVAELLPEGAEVPEHEGRPIRVRHLLTHSSGLPRLPPDMPVSNPHDPYADLDEGWLLSALADTELSHAPGETFAYSNFGAMLLTVALSHRSGEDFDALLERIVTGPLGMENTSLGGAVVQGHDMLGNPVVPWHFTRNLAGVGGVRSDLNDMIRLIQATLNPPDNATGKALLKARDELAAPDGQAMAWAWLLIPVNDRRVLFHNGGTAGATTELVVDAEQGVGAIVLSDTGLAARGGLTDLALHLIDPGVSLQSPRPRPTTSEDLSLGDYAGEYALYDGEEPFMDMVLRIYEEGGSLQLQARTPQVEQPSVEMDHKEGDRFVQEDIGLEIRFIRDDDGQPTGLDFSQGPYELEGRRRQ